MNVLITGGAGFIGSHLAGLLLEGGHHVTVVDDLSTGSLHNITAIRNHPHFSFTRGSVLNKGGLVPLVRKADFIFHLAAAVGVKHIIENPLKTLLVNVDGSRNLFELAARRNIPILITSTSEVYGKSTTVPFAESDDRTYGSAYSERWGYALSKALDECMALAYFREKQLPTIVVRLFNTVGPRQSAQYGMVLPRFIAQAKANEPLTVFGSGKQTRCFSHVHDIVGALKHLMYTKAAYGEIINLGSTESTSIMALAKRVKKMTESNSPIVTISYKEAYSETFEDMQKRVPDLSKARKLLGYMPSYTLQEIITSLI
jgi:UDP-glucose 4-epimerase